MFQERPNGGTFTDFFKLRPRVPGDVVGISQGAILNFLGMWLGFPNDLLNVAQGPPEDFLKILKDLPMDLPNSIKESLYKHKTLIF